MRGTIMTSFYSSQGKAFGIKKNDYEYPAFDGVPNKGIIHTLNFDKAEDISINNQLIWPDTIDLSDYIKVLPRGKYRYNLRVMEYINRDSIAKCLMPSHNDVCSYTVPILQTVTPNKYGGDAITTMFDPDLHHGYLSPDFNALEECHSGIATPNSQRLFMALFATDDKVRHRKLDKDKVYACPMLQRFKVDYLHYSYTLPITDNIISHNHPLTGVWNNPRATYGNFTSALFNYPMVFRRHANRFSPIYKQPALSI